jgi:hypothetical protein
MRKVLICAIVLLMAGIANAQTSGGLKFGVKGGANFSNMISNDEDEEFDTELKTGFHAGIFANIPLVSRLSFAPELVYSQKGYKTTGSRLIGGAYEYTVTTNFVELPLLLNINASSNFNIHVGPQVSFLTSTTETFQQGESQYRTTVEEDNDNLKKNLIGGVIGAGFGIGAKTTLFGRYAIDLQQNNENGTSQTPRYKNQVFQIGLGLSL